MNIWQSNDTSSIGKRPDLSAISLGFVPLYKELLASNQGTLYNLEEEGYVKDDEKNGDTYIEFIKSLPNTRTIVEPISSGIKHYKKIIFLWNDTIVDLTITFQQSLYLSISGLSTRQDLLNQIKDHYQELFISPVKQGHIFSIISQNNKLSLASLGDAGIPLVEYNYPEKVLEGYRNIIKDLQAETPTGRISILEGAPGSGKTFFCRALLTEVPDAMFVLISPDMVPSLAGPELLPLLLTQKNSYSLTGPIVLILEDADQCLVKRASDNIGSIQSLLNLSDGILGSMLDLRIVATTNAKKLEMEPAILRPGRLSQRIEVGALNTDFAKNLFQTLVPDAVIPKAFTISHEMTLAEVYMHAKQAGWTPPKRKDKIPVVRDLPDYYD